MRTLKFTGHRDDMLIEDFTCQYVCSRHPQAPIQCIVNCGKNGKLMVVGQYAEASGNDCWMLGACPVDAETDMPEWKIAIVKYEMGYSPALTVEIPDGEFSLEWLDNGESVMKKGV